ncbi:MAG: GAF domain-containing protein [Anaerolineae bacterium]|nr:GAF domain-containing protein [Anaerolineae bacterium]
MRFRQILAPPVFEGDDEKNRVARLANTILLATVVMISLASVIVMITLRNYVVMGVTYVCLVVPVVVALFILRRGYTRAASLLTVLMLWLVLIVMGTLFGGVVNTSFTTIVVVIMIAALLLGGRVGAMFAFLSFVAVTVVFVSEVVGILPPPLAANEPINYWVTHTVNYAIAALLLYLAMGNLTNAVRRAQRLAVESEVQREQMQILMQQRTQDSERNANYLRATTAVARESAVTMGDSQALFARVAKIIQEQFGFYHVSLYLLDKAAEWVELRALSGAGQALLERGFRLRAGVGSMVGDVARRGVYRLAVDVDQDPVHLHLDELPDTRSELVLPLRLLNQIIGVLDVQSTEAGTFTEQDVQTLLSLADQVAVAISNARLLVEAQQVAEVERRVYGALTADAWQRMVQQAGQTLGFYGDARTVGPAGDLWQPEMKIALQTGSSTHDAQEARRLAVPVKVRGEVIGVIGFTKPAGNSAWTTEEIALVELLTEQLGVALDSARLYQDTQRRAAREQLIGEVTARIRETLDMETMLRTATGEIRQALNLGDLVIRLLPPKADDQGK